MPPVKGFQSGIALAERRFSLLAMRLGNGRLREKELDEDFLTEMLACTRTATFGRASSDENDGSEVLTEVNVDDAEKGVIGSDQLNADPLTLRTRGLPYVTSVALDTLVRHAYNQTLGQDSRVNLCWRIAAGFTHMRYGKHLKFEFGPGPQEWTSVRVEEVNYGRVFNSERGPSQTLELTLRVMRGQFAGLTFKQLIPYKYVMFKIARDIGFPAFTKLDKNDLVLSGFVGLLDPGAKYGPAIVEFHAGTSLQDRNRRIYKLRNTPCLLGYNWPCVKCTLGHRSGSINDYDKHELIDDGSSCMRATHVNSYVKRPCSRCNGDKWFDPYDTGAICISCQNEEAFTRLKAAQH